MIGLALRLLLVSKLALFPAFLEGDKIFSGKLSKLYRSSRDDSRARMSSRDWMRLYQKETTGDPTTDVLVWGLAPYACDINY